LNTRGGGDSPFLLLRTQQLATGLRAGHFPVRWMPDAAYGFGYPFFSYYAALPYYVAAILHMSGLDLLAAVKLTQTLFAVAAALGMYGWARRMLGSRAAGWLTAAAYTFAPFHLVNLYVRGDSLSEFAAFAFYPLILWGLKRPTLRRVLPTALAYAGLILTHNISAVIFSPFALLYLAALAWRTDNKRRVLGLGFSSLVVGLFLSAWYWLPALAETVQVQLTAQTSGYFFYGNHFRWNDLVQRSLLFGYEIGEGRTPFAMGLAQAALTLAGGAAILTGWVRRRRTDWAGRVALGGLVLSTLMITPISRPLWDTLPLLPLVQFPWRFLSVQALFAALTAGALIRTPPRHRWRPATALAVLLAVAGLGRLHPDYLPVAAEEVTAERLQLYELFTGNIGSSIRYEYLPRAAVPRPWTGPALFDPQDPPQPRLLAGELVDAQETVHRPTRRIWKIATGKSGADVALPLYWWPGWRVWLDGEAVEAGPAPDSGLLVLAVPPGRHTAVLALGRTPLRAAAECISLAAILLSAILAWVGLRQGPRPLKPHTRDIGLVVLGGFALAVLAVASPRVAPAGNSDLSMDFEQMPFLHHNPTGVDFGPVRLIEYGYSSDQLAPGEPLTVTLWWEGEMEGLEAAARLDSPAAHLHSAPHSWTEGRAALTSTTVLTLPVPPQTSPGPTLVALEVEGPEGTLTSRSPRGRTLGTTYLRPVWVRAAKPAPADALAELAGGAVLLHTLETTQDRAEQLVVNLEWSATRPLAANLGLNLRLTDPAGNEWIRVDTQPGYGFLPTGLWPAGQSLPDRYVLPLPPGTPPGREYTLGVALYRVATWEGAGEITATISITHPTLRPDAPLLADLGGGLALSDIEVPGQVRQGETLRWTARWLALERPEAATAHWRLEGPATISVTLPLAPGSDPATWPAGAWVTGQAALTLPPATPTGSYTLTLVLQDAAGRPLGTYTHPRPVTVKGRERVWELGPMEQEVGATFGGVIALAGYDMEQEGDTLRLTLHWQALAEPGRHLMFFVHVADPTTTRPVAQVDTMPRGFTYPTGLWTAGEVVSDQVEVSLAAVAAGTYDLVVGWYDPESGERLETRDATGNLVPDGRLVLPNSVTVP